MILTRITNQFAKFYTIKCPEMHGCWITFKRVEFSQKLHRVNVAGYILEQVNSDPLSIQSIITDDETWRKKKKRNKKNISKGMKSESHAVRFLWLSWCSKWFYVNKEYYLQVDIWQKMCLWNSLICKKKTLGCCTMITHRLTRLILWTLFCDWLLTFSVVTSFLL